MNYNAFAVLDDDFRELPVDFVIVTEHPTTSDDGAPQERRIVQVGDTKIVYWKDCTTYFEIKHHANNGKIVQIFVSNSDVDYPKLERNPTLQMPAMTDIRVQEALA